jgi:hypothetical protein
VVERRGSGVLAMVAEACLVKPFAAATIAAGSSTSSSSAALPSTASSSSAAAAADGAAARPGVTNGGVAAAAAAASHLCAACGSQDLQLVRSLREFVAIKTVSADQVSLEEAGGCSTSLSWCFRRGSGCIPSTCCINPAVAPNALWPHVCYPEPLTRHCTVLPPTPPPCHPLSVPSETAG